MPDAVTVVRLPLPHPGADPVRLIMQRVGGVDLTLADRLHDGSAPRPYAVARNPQTLDVVAFDDALARALLASGDGARIAARRKPCEIAPTNSGGRYLRLAFHTPTHFRVAGLDYLLPDPFHVFGGLRERWDTLGWPELPWPNLKRVAVGIETLRAVEFPAQAGHQRRGFAGVVRFDLLPLDAADSAAVWALARFGEWRGVGAHTSYGMGRMRVLGLKQRTDTVPHVWSE